MPTADEIRNPDQPVVLAWPEFQDMFSNAHKPGEHIALVGANGTGKTVLGLECCKIIGARIASDKRPSRVTVLQYKPRDDTLKKVIPDWPLCKTWPPAYGQEHCIVWPKATKASKMVDRQRAVFLPLLDQMYQEGNQTVYIPEAAYFERAYPHGLGAGGLMEQFWSTARSLGLSVVSDTQRPCRVTRLMWSEPAWLMIYSLEDEEDLKRVAQLSGRKWSVIQCIPQLGEHEFMCIRRQRHEGAREIYVSRVDMSN